MTTAPIPGHALRHQIDQLADDIGRLHRRVEPGSSLEHLADRIASHVEALHLLVTPTAGELVMWHAPGDEEAVTEALQIADTHWAQLQARLRTTPA